MPKEPDKAELAEISIEEPAWVRKISSVPDWLSSSLFVLPSVPAAFIMTPDPIWGRILVVIVFLLMLSVAAFLAWLKSSRNEKLVEARKQENKDKVQKEQDAYAATFDEMNAAMFNLSAALAEPKNIQKAREFPIVRKSVLGMVRHQLGSNGGVQANLFVVDAKSTDEEDVCLSAWKWGTDGGGGQVSERKFRPGDTTYEHAINKLHRFVPDVAELSDGEKPTRRYKTFASYPVSSDDALFGILTIDAPEPGDITDLDIQLLGFFAAILSITFILEKDASKIIRP